MIIALDGAKGAGKSSVSQILFSRIDESVALSLDAERGLLDKKDRNKTELNKEAFENLFIKTQTLLRSGKIIILDCGLTEERVIRLEDLAMQENVSFHKIFLEASRETLLKRVQERDYAKGIETDVKRFNETFDIANAKKKDSFYVILTEEKTIEEISNEILKIITRD